MTRPKPTLAVVDAASPDGREAVRNEPSQVEAIAVKICALVHEHGSSELGAAALALVETVRSEVREPEAGRVRNASASKQKD